MIGTWGNLVFSPYLLWEALVKDLKRVIQKEHNKTLFDSSKLAYKPSLLWKLWILQSYSWKTRYGSTTSGTLKQEELILISLSCYHLLVRTLINSFIYSFQEQLLIVTFLVTDNNKLLTRIPSLLCLASL